MKLYEIDVRISTLLDKIQEFTDDEGVINEEVNSEINNYLKDLEIEREKKWEGVAVLIKSLTAEEKALKEEKKNLDSRIKNTVSKTEFLKSYLQCSLQGEKFKTAKVNVTYRKSQSVNLLRDPEEIPEEWQKKTIQVDKAGLKKFLQSEGDKAYAELKEKNNIQIK